jgi:hypothetical protein
MIIGVIEEIAHYLMGTWIERWLSGKSPPFDSFRVIFQKGDWRRSLMNFANPRDLPTLEDLSTMSITRAVLMLRAKPFQMLKRALLKPVRASPPPAGTVLVTVLHALGQWYTMTLSHISLPLSDSAYKLSGPSPGRVRA